MVDLDSKAKVDELLDELKTYYSAGEKEKLRSMLEANQELATVALCEGETDLARELVKLGAPVDVCVASGVGDIDSLEALLEDPERLRKIAEVGTGTIHAARMVREELARPLAIASINGQLESVFFLLRRGADVNSVCNEEPIDGATPLHWASRFGQMELVKFLINYGADLNAKVSKKDSTEDSTDRSTPSDWARSAGHERIAQYLDHLLGKK